MGRKNDAVPESGRDEMLVELMIESPWLCVEEAKVKMRLNERRSRQAALEVTKAGQKCKMRSSESCDLLKLECSSGDESGGYWPQ